MSKFLIVAATLLEVQPLIQHYKMVITDPVSRPIKGSSFDLLITGVGGCATSFALGQVSEPEQYKFALNVGIAGCFSAKEVGSVFTVSSDMFADFGKRKHSHFSFFKMGSCNEAFTDVLYFTPTYSLSALPLPTANSFSVNALQQKPDYLTLLNDNIPSLETMEGAAFFYACEHLGLKSCQLRAVSNVVGEQNRKLWKVDTAVEALFVVIQKVIQNEKK